MDPGGHCWSWFWLCSLFTVWCYYLISLFPAPSCVKSGSTSTYSAGWGEDKMRWLCRVLGLLPGPQWVFDIEMICFFTSELHALLWWVTPESPCLGMFRSLRVWKFPGTARSEILKFSLYWSQLVHHPMKAATFLPLSGPSLGLFLLWPEERSQKGQPSQVIDHSPPSDVLQFLRGLWHTRSGAPAIHRICNTPTPCEFQGKCSTPSFLQGWRLYSKSPPSPHSQRPGDGPRTWLSSEDIHARGARNRPHPVVESVPWHMIPPLSILWVPIPSRNFFLLLKYPDLDFSYERLGFSWTLLMKHFGSKETHCFPKAGTPLPPTINKCSATT